MGILKSVLKEYGIDWVINRALYELKTKMLSFIPITEILFEKSVSIKRIDIFDFDINSIKTFLNNLHEDKKTDIIETADKAIKGTITGFSSIELDFGFPLDWQLNPLTGYSASNKLKWYRIPDFDSTRGDVKVIWEASRFIHFYYFVRAYLITGDIKYYNAYSDQLSNWLENNPYSYGANYKCGQECTLRMINAMIVHTIFTQCGLGSSKDRLNIDKLINDSYKKILSNFFYAHKCIQNNHTFSEICGLIIGAWCCKNDRNLKKAYSLLNNEIENQFYADGGYKQFSFNYQRFSLQIIECILKISQKTGFDISAYSKSIIKNSVLLMYQMQSANGDLPNYGSNDGALIFPLTSSGYRDFSPVLNTVYALIEDRRLYESGDCDEELLWFDAKSIKRANIMRKSAAFRRSGFYSIRTSDSLLMIVLQEYKSRPAHCDGLHIDLWYRGINILCDGGTYSYAHKIGTELAMTGAHNVAQVSNLEQMNKKGAFLVYDWYTCKNIQHTGNSFIGTLISKNGYSHTRKIIQSDNEYLVEDEVEAQSASYEILLHTPCQVQIKGNIVELSVKGVAVCLIEYSGRIEMKPALRSLYYLQKEEINCIILKQLNNSTKVIYKIKLV